MFVADYFIYTHGTLSYMQQDGEISCERFSIKKIKKDWELPNGENFDRGKY